ncbi:MAG: hypothetical protein JXB07_21385, partial [Anaerolineae bacterium]|nr:hypothetical protein [Anaerolineae bacterium]
MRPIHSNCPSDSLPGPVSRRSLLKVIGAVLGGVLLDGCTAQSPAPTVSPLVTPSDPQTPWPTAAPSQVGIAQAATYEPKLVRKQVETLFDSLGGLQDIVKTGDKVAIKVNLVGGTQGNIPPAGTTAPESYVTHPEVARAIGELLLDA